MDDDATIRKRFGVPDDAVWRALVESMIFDSKVTMWEGKLLRIIEANVDDPPGLWDAITVEMNGVEKKVRDATHVALKALLQKAEAQIRLSKKKKQA